MKKILIIISTLLLASLLTAQVTRIAILNFEKNDRESGYITDRLKKSDFKEVFGEYDKFELIDTKDVEKAMKELNYKDPSYMGKSEIYSLGEKVGADVVIMGNVTARSATEFKISSTIFSMKSKDVTALTFNVTKDTESRRKALKDNLITKIDEFSGGEIGKLLDIGKQHFNSKNYDAAEETFINILEIDPRNLDSAFYLGLINYINENYEESEFFYQKALSIDPENKDVRDYISQTYLKMHKYEEAIEVLTEIAENEDDKEVWLRIGFINQDIEYMDDAQTAFENALEIDPDYSEAHLALATLFFELEMYEEAIPYFEKASQVYPDDDNIQKKLASCYKKAGRLDSAIAQYQAIIKEQPDNFKAYVNLANAYTATEQYQKALDTSFKLKDISPNDPRVYILIANAYSSLKQLNNAESQAKTAINMNPELYQPYRILSEVYQAKGYTKYEEYLGLEERYKAAFGKEADDLLIQRDKTKDEAYNMFLQTQTYLNEAKKRTESRNELNYIASREELLKQLLDATKKDFF